MENIESELLFVENERKIEGHKRYLLFTISIDYLRRGRRYLDADLVY